MRSWYIKSHPLCELCLREGRVVEGDILDHIKEISDGGARYGADNVPQAVKTNLRSSKGKEGLSNEKAPGFGPGAVS